MMVGIKSRLQNIIDRRDKLNLKNLALDTPPKQLIHREIQEQLLVEGYSQLISGKNKKPTANNFFFYGKSGTGKTATIKSLMPEIEAEAKKHYNYTYHYFMASDIKNHLRFMQMLTADLGLYKEAKARNLDELFTTIRNHLMNSDARFTVCIDEIDKIWRRRELFDILRTLSRFNEKLNLKEPRAFYIVISNQSKDELDIESEPSVFSSFRPDDILFRPYNKEELRDILETRIHDTFRNRKIFSNTDKEAIIEYVSDKGDARLMIEILVKCANSYARINHFKISEIIDNHKQSAESKFFETLSIGEIKIIAPFFFIKNANKFPELTSEQTYKLYLKLCEENNLSKVQSRQYKRILNEFYNKRLLKRTTKREKAKRRPPHAYKLNSDFLDFDRAVNIFSNRWHKHIILNE